MPTPSQTFAWVTRDDSKTEVAAPATAKANAGFPSHTKDHD
ncbi:MAG: hypothetical protein QF511_03130 [Rhodospirillales bacterium]|jgi:hypothetical protein|nr:hypothetical protein [Rhodospirillales bacterium]MDP7214798.1 hypothetical protein [Rhodospirillales bacterium]HJP53485.1 hypothetical protein [Rhodospirillales bacterium]